MALHQFEGRGSRLLDRQPLAYHPDSAKWLSDDLVVAAVENAGSLDFFRIENGRMVRVHQAHVGFAPRDVILVSASQGHYKLLATPYSGKDVAWVDWYEDNRQAASVKRTRWCEAPWHPVGVIQLPGASGGGTAAACLDDRKVVAVSETDPLAAPRVLASFDAVARQVRPSPSGQWLYVALETGGRNARIHMQTGELQWIASPLTGSVAVAPLADDLVAWGEDGKLYLQRLDPEGRVLETRWIKTSGFSTGLQLIDLDGDGERDMVVLNSADAVVDVIYGPLWDRAVQRL
ncbi:MAG: VCBS repeat-containing protein [Acidovorax sp.]|uniref:FG-GAP repeat domain-containing protein n=1 Tax=Acidovorax sp. TaxID=1872122 RepID=UPI0025BDBCE5|nr:VCBS repeat-containing protein [Acidovorax sp.]MCE1193689.1 VCBS repeat-containing protein [Acidovorax sp.]